MRGDFTQVTLDLERALAAVPLASLSVSTQVQTDVTALRGDLVGAKFQMAAMQETLVTEMRKQVLGGCSATPSLPVQSQGTCRNLQVDGP